MRLFVGPRTVEYHLRKVFTKLGITSQISADAQNLHKPTVGGAMHGSPRPPTGGRRSTRDSGRGRGGSVR